MHSSDSAFLSAVYRRRQHQGKRACSREAVSDQDEDLQPRKLDIDSNDYTPGMLISQLLCLCCQKRRR